MKIRMLGTGYGECKIKKKTLKDYRHLGGVLIDEKILIDAPADIFEVAEELGFSDMFDKVSDVVISHSHRGHFSVDAIMSLAKRGIRVYGTGKLLDLIPDAAGMRKSSFQRLHPCRLTIIPSIPFPQTTPPMLKVRCASTSFCRATRRFCMPLMAEV